MRLTAAFLFLSLLLAPQVSAGVFIAEPKDEAVVFKDVVMLTGVASDVAVLRVNDQPIKIAYDGAYSCGLALRAGKNLVKVNDQSLRLLRLVTFPDIEQGGEGGKHWARNQIVYLATLGYIEGGADGNFYPAEPITRGEFATWLARVKGLKLTALEQDVFFDVPKESWRAPYIKATVDAGYMHGYGGDVFGVDDAISRQEAAQIAVKAEGVGMVDKIIPIFRDVPKEKEGAATIYSAKQKGLVAGVSNDIPIYDPDRVLSRAEAAVLLSRFQNALGGIVDLFNFDTGFTVGNLCRVNIAPEITNFTVEPGTLKINQNSGLTLRLAVAPRGNFFPIAKVKVDLSKIGGVPDAEMFDDGTQGDEQANDLVYSLSLFLSPSEIGDKVLTATAVDQLGWESRRQVSLLVIE